MKFAVLLPLLLAWGTATAMGTRPASPPPKPAAAAPGMASEMLRDDDLRATPETSGRVLVRLPRGARVRLLGTQGGWSQVMADGHSGWVRVLSVRAVASGQIAADVAGLVTAGSSGRDPGQVVAVAGVRGLNEETLKAAAFNAAEIQLLHSYALGAAEAEQFARAAGLNARPVPYFGAAARDSAANLP